MSTGGEKEYIDKTLESARALWGDEETEKMRQQLEATATAVYHVSQAPIDTDTEPATGLRHREKP